MLKVNVAASAGAGAINEDVVGHCAGAAWVLDGATGVGDPLIPGGSDAAWFATRISAILRDILQDRPDIPTRVLLAQAMAVCRDDLHRAASRQAADAHELPSAAFAMIRETDSGIELCTLGDCRIAYRDEGGVARLFGGDAIKPIEARTIARATEIRRADQHIDQAAFRALLLPQLQENRRMMNRPGGYWILGTDPAAADHADLRTLNPHDGDRFALASDGFLRLVELFDVAEPVDLLAIDSAALFDTQLARLRALEAEPGSIAAFPRIKVQDDACFLHCDYRKEN